MSVSERNYRFRRHASVSPPRRRPLGSDINSSNHPESHQGSPDAPAPRHSPPVHHKMLRSLSAALPSRQVSYGCIIPAKPIDGSSSTTINHSVTTMQTDLPPDQSLRAESEYSTATAITESQNRPEPRLQLLRSPSKNKLLRPLSASGLVRSLAKRGPRSPPLPPRAPTPPPRPSTQSDTERWDGGLNGALKYYTLYLLKISALIIAIAAIVLMKITFFIGRHTGVVWRALVKLLSYLSVQGSTLYTHIQRQWRFNLRSALMVGLRFEMRALRRQASAPSPVLIRQRFAKSLQPTSPTQDQSKETLPPEGSLTFQSTQTREVSSLS